MSWSIPITINKLVQNLRDATSFSQLSITGPALINGNTTIGSDFYVSGNSTLNDVVVNDLTSLSTLNIPQYTNANIPNVNTLSLGSIIYNTTTNKYLGVGEDYEFTPVTIDSSNYTLKTAFAERYITPGTYSDLNTFVGAIQTALLGIIDLRISTLNKKFTFISLTGSFEKLDFNTNIPDNNALAPILGFLPNTSNQIKPDKWEYAPNISTIYQFQKKYVEFGISSQPPSNYWTGSINNSIVNTNSGGQVGINIGYISTSSSLITDTLNIQNLDSVGFVKSTLLGDLTNFSKILTNEISSNSNLNINQYVFQSSGVASLPNDIPNKFYTDTKWAKGGDTVTGDSVLGTLNNYNLAIIRNNSDQIVLKPTEIEFKNNGDFKTHYVRSSYNPSNIHDLTNKEYVDNQDNLKLNISGGTITGSLYIGNIDTNLNNLNLGNNATKINIGCGSNIQTVNIGSDNTSGATTINLGGAGDTVNISGTLAYVNVTNLSILDKDIILNSGAMSAGMARDSGISITDNGNTQASYIKTSSLGTSFVMKAPENNYILSTPILTQNETIGTVTQIGTKASTSYVDSQDSLRVLKSGDSMSGNLTVNPSVTISGAGVNGTGGILYFADANHYIQRPSGTNDIRIQPFNNLLLMPNTGNVGIGTTSPNAPLTISKDYQNGGTHPEETFNKILLKANDSYGVGIQLRVPENNTINQSDMQLSTCDNDGNQLVRMTIKGSSNPEGGNVGINSSNPNHKLEIRNAQTASAGIVDGSQTLYLQDTNSAPYNGGTLVFGASQGYFAGIRGCIIDGTNYTKGYLSFCTRENSTDTILSQRMEITDKGVNINVNNSGHALWCNKHVYNYDAVNNPYTYGQQWLYPYDTRYKMIIDSHGNWYRLAKQYPNDPGNPNSAITTQDMFFIDDNGLNLKKGNYMVNGVQVGATVAQCAVGWNGSAWAIDTNYKNWGCTVTSNFSTQFDVVLPTAYPTPYPLPFLTVGFGATFPVARVNGFNNGGNANNYFRINLSSSPFPGDTVFFSAQL